MPHNLKPSITLYCSFKAIIAMLITTVCWYLTALFFGTHACAQMQQGVLNQVYKVSNNPWQILADLQKNATQRNYHALVRVKNSRKNQHFRVTHFYDGSSEYEKIISLDDENRHILRLNQLVQIYQRDSQSITTDNRLDATLPFLSTDLDMLPNNYIMQGPNLETYLQKNYQVWSLKSKLSDRFDYKIYVVDGMMVRLQTIWKNKILEESQLVHIDYMDYQGATVYQWLEFGKDWQRSDRRNQQALMMQKNMRKIPVLGTRFPDNFQGFVKKLDTPDILGRKILHHAVYSDGMTTFSIFVELLNHDDKKSSDGELLNPPVSIYRQKNGQELYTLVGEVPLEILKRFYSELKIKK